MSNINQITGQVVIISCLPDIDTNSLTFSPTLSTCILLCHKLQILICEQQRDFWIVYISIITLNDFQLSFDFGMITTSPTAGLKT